MRTSQNRCALLLLLIAVSDYKYSIIPDHFTLVLFFAALTFSSYDLLSGQKLFHSGWLSPILGAAGGAALMLALGFAGRLVYKKEALGFGDVKLFAAAGLFAGFPSVFLIFLLTVFLAFFYIIFLLFRRKITKDLYLPLGPYICLALALFSGLVRAGTIPEPKAQTWPGTIALQVDATDLERKIFRVRERIPVRPGPLVLLYPQWVPG